MATTVEVKRSEKTAAPARAPAPVTDLWQSFRNDLQRLFDQFWTRGSFPSFPSLPRAFDL
jgi:hypothetical protein